MGKFDGILICSDYDSTFFGQGAEVENAEKLKYFAENGGRFAFATGHTVSFMRQNRYFGLVNAPACLFNGAVVYDYAEEKVLRERRLPYSAREFAKAISFEVKGLRKAEVYGDAFCGAKEYADISFDDVENGLNPLKIICIFETAEAALAFKAKCEKIALFKGTTFISRSWGPGVEFNAVDGTKGDAAVFIKEHLGNIHTLIGVGDYENDLTLVEYSDIGAAVGNAIEALKEKADIVTVPCAEGAICELIRLLEKGDGVED